MRKTNQLLTFFYTINLFVSTAIYSALLSTTNTIHIQEHLLNVIVIIFLVVIGSIIFLIVNPFFLKKLKAVFNEDYNAVSEKTLKDLINYPFTTIPLMFITVLLIFIIYLIAGNYTNIISINDVYLSSFIGFLFSFLFAIGISIISYVYSTKITTNSYISKVIKKLDILEIKSFLLPIKYKIIGVFTIITVLSFLVIVYAIINNAIKYTKENLYNNTIKSANILSKILDNNNNADSILKDFTEKFKKNYNFYLYGLNNKNIITYSNSSLSNNILEKISSKSEIKDTKNDQTLFILTNPITFNNNKFLLVVGVENKIYKTIFYKFILNMLVVGIFILFIVIGTTVLISSELSSHVKQLLDHSIALSEKKLNQLPPIVSTDEFGIVSLNLRKLVKNFKESKNNMNINIALMSNAVASIKNNLSRIKTTITDQANYTDNLLSITNSIKDISKTITDISLQFNSSIDESSNNINKAMQKNKEIKTSISYFSHQIGEILKLIEKDINIYEDIKYTFVKLQNILYSVNTNYNLFKKQIVGANNEITDHKKSMIEIQSLNNKNIELTKDLQIITNETKNITDKMLVFLTTFLSHISQVDDMLGIINNVAERTNLLSVNAFILAASPQVEERNFRVMAEEIKKLAGRARSGSTEISDYITKVKRNIDELALQMQDINSSVSILEQSITDINILNYKTEELTSSTLKVLNKLIEVHENQLSTNNSSSDLSNEPAISMINVVLERTSSIIENIKSISNVFTEIRNQFLNLIELTNNNENVLAPLNNAIENIRTFISYINDSLSIDIKEQIFTFSSSTSGLIKQIKESEQNIIDLESIVIQLLQELDLLKENINLFIG